MPAPAGIVRPRHRLVARRTNGFPAGRHPHIRTGLSAGEADGRSRTDSLKLQGLRPSPTRRAVLACRRGLRSGRIPRTGQAGAGI